MAQLTLNQAKKTLNSKYTFSKLLDSYRGCGFWDLTVNRYGDVCEFRVYDNKEITER